MHIDDINAIINAQSSTVFDSEKTASVFPYHMFASLAPGAQQAVGTAAKATSGWLGRLFAPMASRFRAGAQQGLSNYTVGSTARELARGGAQPGWLGNAWENARRRMAQYGGGAYEAIAGSAPARLGYQLGNRNSDFWRSGVGYALGRDPLTGAFTLMAGVEGARKGKEVGGTGGAIAGGLAGFGGARAAWGFSDLLKRGLIKDVQGQMLAGNMQALRARPGMLRGAVGDWLNRGGQALENVFGQQGKLVGNKGIMNSTVQYLQKARNAAAQTALPAVKGGVPLPVATGAGAGMPDLSMLATIPIGLGAMWLGDAAASASGKGAFNAYKRFADNANQQQQRQYAQEDYFRRNSPEFRTTQYNPYGPR